MIPLARSIDLRLLYPRSLVAIAVKKEKVPPVKKEQADSKPPVTVIPVTSHATVVQTASTASILTAATQPTRTKPQAYLFGASQGTQASITASKTIAESKTILAGALGKIATTASTTERKTVLQGVTGKPIQSIGMGRGNIVAGKATHNVAVKGVPLPKPPPLITPGKSITPGKPTTHTTTTIGRQMKQSSLKSTFAFPTTTQVQKQSIPSTQEVKSAITTASSTAITTPLISILLPQSIQAQVASLSQYVTAQPPAVSHPTSQTPQTSLSLRAPSSPATQVQSALTPTTAAVGTKPMTSISSTKFYSATAPTVKVVPVVQGTKAVTSAHTPTTTKSPSPSHQATAKATPRVPSTISLFPAKAFAHTTARDPSPLTAIRTGNVGITMANPIPSPHSVPVVNPLKSPQEQVMQIFGEHSYGNHKSPSSKSPQATVLMQSGNIPVTGISQEDPMSHPLLLAAAQHSRMTASSTTTNQNSNSSAGSHTHIVPSTKIMKIPPQ